jgi:hypothetical protein
MLLAQGPVCQIMHDVICSKGRPETPMLPTRARHPLPFARAAPCTGKTGCGRPAQHQSKLEISWWRSSSLTSRPVAARRTESFTISAVRAAWGILEMVGLVRSASFLA